MQEALLKISKPVAYLQAEAEKEGALLNGQMAVELSQNANWLREVATNALKQIKEA